MRVPRSGVTFKVAISSSTPRGNGKQQTASETSRRSSIQAARAGQAIEQRLTRRLNRIVQHVTEGMSRFFAQVSESTDDLSSLFELSSERPEQRVATAYATNL